MVYIGFNTNYINIPLYNQYKVLQVTLGDPSKPTYDNIISLDKPSNKIFIHSKYSYNISKKNINYPIKTEVDFLKSIKEENTGIVIHLSKYYTKHRQEALIDVANKLNELCLKYLYKTTYKILLETSHVYNHLGSRIDDFYVIYEHLTDLSKNHIGICLDTSHIFLSGIDISNINILLDYLAMFEQKVGLKYINLIHLNDINSVLFGNHTPHLSVFNENGKIFFNNYLILDIFLLLSKMYNIPIILERNNDIKLINEEINFIITHTLNFSMANFTSIIKNLIVLDFIKLLEDYYTFIDNKYLISLNKFKKYLINLYDYNNKQYLDSKNIYKTETNILKFLDSDEYKFIYSDIERIYKNYSYDIFLYYLNNDNYKSLKELNNIKFLGIETVKKLYNYYNIHNIEELQSLSIVQRKKLLTVPQYKALQCYKFINKETPINILLIIVDDLVSFNYNLYVFGSLYRYKLSLQTEKAIKDIDLLLVKKSDEDITNFLSDLKEKYMFKGILIDGEKKKSIVLKYASKKNYYFILDLYICTEKEFVFMSIYLKGPIEKNIILRKIAKSKGYTLSNTELIDNNKKNYYFNTEEELYSFLKYKIK
jgi:deoxyribonuclease IV